MGKCKKSSGKKGLHNFKIPSFDVKVINKLVQSARYAYLALSFGCLAGNLKVKLTLSFSGLLTSFLRKSVPLSYSSYL